MTFLSDRAKQKLHEIIFEADTHAGKVFDMILIATIIASVIVVMLESVESIREEHAQLLHTLEWTFTIIFTLEYVARILVVKKPVYYMTSFFGVIDLLSIAPTYLSVFSYGAHALMVFRILRLLRIFRVLKLVRFLSEAKHLSTALRLSVPKITVFLVGVLCANLIVGSLMYIIEGAEHGFDSIPRGIYWAIVTMTTVGYGDISPQTVLGQILASFVMIMGYGIIAVPTGIVTSKLHMLKEPEISTQSCPGCGREGHDMGAKFCKYCGDKL
jgi:voltage-gated potassium channel